MISFLSLELHSNTINIDLAVQNDKEKIKLIFQKFIDHPKASLSIYYSFGHAYLSYPKPNDKLQVKVTLSGELDATEKASSYICQKPFIKTLNWFHHKGALLEQPPFKQLSQSSQCYKE